MAGFPEPRLNQQLLAPDGRSLGQPDMLFEEQRIIVEYDGAPHRAASQQVKDRQRRELRTSYGWIELQVFHPDLHLPRRLVRMMFNPGKPMLPRITSGEVPATTRLAEASTSAGGGRRTEPVADEKLRNWRKRHKGSRTDARGACSMPPTSTRRSTPMLAATAKPRARFRICRPASAPRLRGGNAGGAGRPSRPAARRASWSAPPRNPLPRTR